MNMIEVKRNTNDYPDGNKDQQQKVEDINEAFGAIADAAKLAGKDIRERVEKKLLDGEISRIGKLEAKGLTRIIETSISENKSFADTGLHDVYKPFFNALKAGAWQEQVSLLSEISESDTERPDGASNLSMVDIRAYGTWFLDYLESRLTEAEKGELKVLLSSLNSTPGKIDRGDWALPVQAEDETSESYRERLQNLVRRQYRE